MRLRDLFTGALTWRELSSLVRGLPPGSATRTAMNAGTPEPSSETVVLADVYDRLAALDHHFIAANSDPKKAKPKPPKPYPRWWDTATRDTRHSPERVARIEDARRRRAERHRLIAEGRIA